MGSNILRHAYSLGVGVCLVKCGFVLLFECSCGYGFTVPTVYLELRIIWPWFIYTTLISFTLFISVIMSSFSISIIHFSVLIGVK